MDDVRLIDANALLSGVMGLTVVSPEVMNYANAVALAIADAPTIDAVPVVRCRQCKYYNRALRLCNNGLGARPFEFYCADGAKKDGGADK